ncbi:MAG: cyclic nucleotide-binding domain-containing protein, partial [Myxococcales bacterium]|nr:cyclic nucleotide-binding domain-containing protein [Myxococcales bacterium]
MNSFFDYGGTQSDDRFLSNWSDLDWKKFMTFVTTRRFSQGETLVEKGELSRELFVLTQGSIVVDIPQKGAGNLDLSVTISPGNIVGEQAFIDGLPRSQT